MNINPTLSHLPTPLSEVTMEMKMEKRTELAAKIGGAEVSRCLAEYGWSQTLDIMIRISHHSHDWVIEELLAVIGSSYELAKFMNKLPKFELTEEEFEFLVKKGHVL